MEDSVFNKENSLNDAIMNNTLLSIYEKRIERKKISFNKAIEKYNNLLENRNATLKSLEENKVKLDKEYKSTYKPLDKIK